MKTTMFNSLLINKPLRDIFWFYGVIPSNLLWALTLFAYFNGAALATIAPMFALLLVYTLVLELTILHFRAGLPVVARGLRQSYSLMVVLGLLLTTVRP